MNMIVAADSRWGIGKNNGLLASLPSDMKYFREHTAGKVVVMGRKTLESLPGKRGLPGRTNIVLTTRPDFEAERCITVNSEEELFERIAAYEPSGNPYAWHGGLPAETGRTFYMPILRTAAERPYIHLPMVRP